MAVNGFGSSRKTPRPSWVICDVLPCITWGARTTRPPKIWPMHWWPKQTPSTGTPASPKARMASIDTPTSPGSSGLPGTRRHEHGVGLERAQLVERDRVVAVDDRLGAELPEVLHEVVDERVVVVDDEHPHRGNATGPGPHRPGSAKVAAVAPTKKSPAQPTRRPTKGSRYTPPAPKTVKSSRLWVPVTMFTCLALGVIVIAGNYMELLPGGEVSNNFLLIGLVLLDRRVRAVHILPLTLCPIWGEMSEPQACNFTQVCPQAGENPSARRGPCPRGSGGAPRDRPGPRSW